MPSFNFLVDKTNLSETTLVTVDTPTIVEDEILVRIDRFALTANNITYGVAGDMIGYWQFFPADENWGRIPVWGFATVLESRLDSIEAGTRYYGYYPMSGHLVMQPTKVNDRGFKDGVQHRQSLPPVYNQYLKVSVETGYPPEQDDYQMIYRPLFTTSFVLDDYFADNGFFGARQIILSSASSKTAFGMAFMLKRRADEHIKIVGLTSAGNRQFVEDLGLYDEIRTYEEIEQLDKSVPTAYVDMAGNRPVLARLHHHFDTQLVNSCGVGATHWESREGEDPRSLPGARPRMFFAPDQIQKRNKEWGPAEFQNKLGVAWQAFIAVVDDWVQFEESLAPDNLDDVYHRVLAGPSPDKAYVIST